MKKSRGQDEMKTQKLFVVTHKTIENRKFFEEREILYVGFGENEAGYTRDNTGDHITSKNKHYCELTGLYWMWKNCSADIMGLEHYRRVFLTRKINIFRYHLLKKKKIQKVLNKYDIIVPYLYALPKKRTAFESYADSHYGSDLALCYEAIQALYPNYAETFQKVLMKESLILTFNMMICKKELLHQYSTWLFSILSYVEERIDITDRDVYQQRVFGFLSERLLLVWIKANHLKMKHQPVAFLDGSALHCTIKLYLSRGKHRIKRILFRLSKRN